jgi:hypothetical protein
LSRVNIVKRIKIGGRWKMFSIPRNAKGNYDWNAIADGRYYVEWYVGGTRRRVSAGVTAAQALEVQRRKHHELEGRKLGIPGFETAGETVKRPALHVAITKYLEQIEALKKPNTHRKYEAVLNRFGEFFRDCVSIDAISGDDLTRFVVTLKRDHGLGSVVCPAKQRASRALLRNWTPGMRCFYLSATIIGSGYWFHASQLVLFGKPGHRIGGKDLGVG